MERRRNVFFAIVVAAILALMIAGNALVDDGSPIGNSNALASESVKNLSPNPPKPKDFHFEGCWTFSGRVPCYDIYHDSAGDFWLCAKCFETKNPGPNTCIKISLEILNRGYWCV